MVSEPTWREQYPDLGKTVDECKGPIHAQCAIDVWQALPWYKRLWYLVVSAW